MTREELGQRLEEYRAALRSMDPDRCVRLFAEDAEVHDPVDGPVHRGEEQIRAFFTNVMQGRTRLDMTPQASYITPPGAAAVLWSLHAMQQGGSDLHPQGISACDFRGDGKISRMRVYWPADQGPLARDGGEVDRSQMLRWLENYWDVLRSMDTDRYLDLYADDASVEDPVGSPVFQGKAGLRTFFEGVKRGVHLLDLSPVKIILVPPHAAVQFATRVVPRKGREFELPGIATYAFEGSGKVTQMRAYWSLPVVP